MPWDARTLGDWKDQLNGAGGLVNVVGRTVDCIKTPDHQDEILRSRIEATHVLGLAMRSIPAPPPVWVQMSTAHIYGDPPEITCTEDSPLGMGFAPFIGRAWEEAFHASTYPLVPHRVILAPASSSAATACAGGGALKQLRTLVRLGGSLLLKTDPELALYGRYLVSRRLQEMGFEFRFPELGDALANLLARPQ